MSDPPSSLHLARKILPFATTRQRHEVVLSRVHDAVTGFRAPTTMTASEAGKGNDLGTACWGLVKPGNAGSLRDEFVAER